MDLTEDELPSDLNKEDLQELQEKLILIYKFIKQENMYDTFFLKGIESEKPFKYKNELINKLLEIDDADELLKASIIELEGLKNENQEKEITLADILEKQDMEVLYYKYGIKDIYDVDKLDIIDLLRLF